MLLGIVMTILGVLARALPVGFAYITDEDGAFLLDEDGLYLISDV